MVVTANVTLPIIGQDNACQPSIQCNVGLGISGEHQQVGRIIPPANLFLFKKKRHGIFSYVISAEQRPQNLQT